MAFEEINLPVIYLLLQSDWLAQNLELEPLNPGMSVLTNVSFILPANFRKRMHIRIKYTASLCACVCACLRISVYVRCCVRTCMCLIVCVVFRECICAYVFFQECVFVGVYSCVNVCS